MIAALLALTLLAPPPRDTVLVEVVLVATSERIVVEALAQDTTLYLPAGALHTLLGIPLPPTPWVSLDQLRQAYPTVGVFWRPAFGEVAIVDELAVLPRTRQFRETTRVAALGTLALPEFTGPYGGFAVDDQRRALLDAGFLYQGRLSVSTRVDDGGAAQWAVSAAPSPHLFLNYAGGTTQPAQFSGRVAVGPLWFSASYAPHQPLAVAGLVRVGPLTAFASRDVAVLTLSPSPWWALQVAHTTTGRVLARVSWGPVPASPFSIPLTTLH